MFPKSVNLFFILSVVIYQRPIFVLSSSLYSPHDPLWELDGGNFERITFGKNVAWAIEFYNSWCGHCIRFAPTYTNFSKDIQNWRNVIEIGVVNCVDPENVKLCRDYGVEGFPTIKLFGPYINGSDKGKVINVKRDVQSLLTAATSFVESVEDPPSGWPNLKPLESSHIREIFKEQAPNVNSIYLVVEDASSNVGREIILDLSIKKQLVVRRVPSTNQLLVKGLVDQLDNTTVFLKVDKKGRKEVVYRFDNTINTTHMRNEVFKSVIGYPRLQDHRVTTVKPHDFDKTVTNAVYMADLENAVRYSLRNEVGVHTNISGPKLQVLKSYIQALKRFFPGKPETINYLSKIYSWLLRRKGPITGERFIEELDKFESNDTYLPDMQDWVGCRGSDPRYRGYPCSLWTLFHTLTVHAYAAFEENHQDEKEALDSILYTIKGYVTHFFTCRVCSEHFQQMSANLTQELKRPKDNVLWLWQAHNKVNKRLSGDATEDPKHPKIQFPPKTACRQCYAKPDDNSDTIEWDENAVLRYLQYFYKTDIKREAVDSTFHHSSIVENEQGITDTGRYLVSVQSLLLLALFAILGAAV